MNYIHWFNHVRLMERNGDMTPGCGCGVEVIFAFGSKSPAGRNGIHMLRMLIIPGDGLYVDDQVSVASTSWWYFQSAVALTKSGDPVLVMHSSSSAARPGASWVSFDGLDRAQGNTVRVCCTQGDDTESTGDGVYRWGDLTSAVTDPRNSNSVIVDGELTAAGEWSSKIVDVVDTAYAYL